MKKPYVVINMVMTLDGHIATSEGQCNFGSREDRRRMDILRSRADAILVTRSTVEKDNPLLYDRRDPAKPNQPIPIIVLKNLEKPMDFSLKVFQKPHRKGIFAIFGKPKEKINHPFWESCFFSSAKELVEHLQKKNLYHLLIEGGPTLNSMFLQENLVDELRLTLSPYVLGNPSNKRIFSLSHGIYSFRLKSVERRKDEVFLRYLKLS